MCFLRGSFGLSLQFMKFTTNMQLSQADYIAVHTYQNRVLSETLFLTCQLYHEEVIINMLYSPTVCFSAESTSFFKTLFQSHEKDEKACDMTSKITP